MRNVLGTWQATCNHNLVSKQSSGGRVRKSKERVKWADRQRKPSIRGSGGKAKGVGKGTHTCSRVRIKIIIEFGCANFQRRTV